MELTCPKCQGAMRSYERSGVLIDQCAECRGIFLDRGELEKLVDAETAYNAEPARPAAPAAPAASPAPAWGTSEPARYEEPYRGRDDRRYDERRYDDDRRYQQRHYDDDYRYGKKRKKSFLENLFDD